MDRMKCRRLCAFDAARGPRRLMRVGLALILVGHVNLLLGAVLHGTVLRHVANPRGAVTPEYTTANVISVGSGLLDCWILWYRWTRGLDMLTAPLTPRKSILFADTALALWIPSVFMSAAEAALSAYCCVAALTLRGVGPCRKDGLQEQLEELTEFEFPKRKWQENVQLLDQTRDIRTSQKSWV
ncbi:KRTCAP3 [Cervus elaphus hippelaphus]|uniref:KRTCAP3 n=1 Tax=Cervus elaphus hippelaphus TaxID=46360 RepID=A0A212CWR4_CEREH|nr:KRTCAP3 [Cervus elaphus hippelaphus]